MYVCLKQDKLSSQLAAISSIFNSGVKFDEKNPNAIDTCLTDWSDPMFLLYLDADDFEPDKIGARLASDKWDGEDEEDDTKDAWDKEEEANENEDPDSAGADGVKGKE